MFGDNVFKNEKPEPASKPNKASDPPVKVDAEKKPQPNPAPVKSDVFDFDGVGGPEGFISACKGLSEQQKASGKTVTLKGCPASEVDVIGSSFRGQHDKPVYVNGDLRYPR
jgi:hypothetical protein